MEEKKQHVQVPKMNLKDDHLNNLDPYVYAWIKRFMNNESKQAFPSVQTLCNKTGLYRETITASVDRLEAAGYIKVIRQLGKPNIYVFNDYKKFEIFSYDFLDNQELTPKNKAYLVASQQYMFKSPKTNSGSIKFDTRKFANMINLSLPTMRKQEKELQDKGVLVINPTNQLELIEADGQIIPSTGLYIDERIYNFNNFCNVLALKFLEQDEKIDKNTDDIAVLKDELSDTKTKLAKALQEIENLKNQKEMKIIL